MSFVGQGYENHPLSNTSIIHYVPTLITSELQLWCQAVNFVDDWSSSISVPFIVNTFLKIMLFNHDIRAKHEDY